MRLIDANEVIKNIVYERDKIPYELVSEKPYHAGDQMRGGIRKALRCIEQAPTVDAVPVSELKKLRDYLYAEDLIFMRGLAELNKLIVNCGAKMDGGAD